MDAEKIFDLHEKEPSAVHTALGALEQKGYLKALITQNIDLLHQKGGSRRVIEIHGSPFRPLLPALTEVFLLDFGKPFLHLLLGGLIIQKLTVEPSGSFGPQKSFESRTCG